MSKTKTRSERLLSVNETKLKIIDLDIVEDLATKILFRMLDNYHAHGTTYINKELRFVGRHTIGRKYIVNLYNNPNKRDIVLIRALDDSVDETDEEKTQRIIEQNVRNVQHTWKRDPVQSSSDDSDNDAPELVH